MSFFDRFKKVIAPKSEPVANSNQSSSEEESVPPAPSERASEKGLESADPRNHHLLLITDKPAVIQDLELLVFPLRDTWHVAITGDEAHALEVSGKVKFDAVICDGVGKNWKEFLAKLSQSNPKILRFLRCPPKETAWKGTLGDDPPQHISNELDAQGIADFVNRALNLQVWMGNEDVRKVLAKMERMPSVPTLYTQVLSELAKPDSSINFVGRLISKDPAQSAKMLQCVNSAAFGLAREISDPVEAVLHMGSERTKSVLLVSSVFLNFNNFPCAGFSHEKWWQHSMVVGGFARLLAAQELKDPKLGDLAFTAGLMHDTGKLLLAANLPDVYSKILEQAKRRDVSVGLVEKEIFGVTHAEIGACFLGTWGLPFSILSAIGWHHCPVESADEKFSLLTTVHAGDAFENEKKEELQGIRRTRLQLDYLKKIDVLGRTNRWRTACGCLPKDEVDPFLEQKAA